MKRICLQYLWVAICTAIAAALLSPQSSTASGIVYQLDTPFNSGDPNAVGYVQETFQNVAGGVLLTVTNVNFATGEFVNGNGSGANGGLFFNINPADNVNNLTFTLESGPNNFGTTIKTGENAFKADGDGKYDIVFDFTPNTFTVDSSITYLLSGIQGLTASDFAYLSDSTAGESGPFYAAAHIAGVPGGQSTWIEPGGGPMLIPVPEPSSIGLLTAGFGLWGVFRQWRKRKA